MAGNSGTHKGDLKRKIAAYTYRALRWGRDHVPPGARTVVGILFFIGGIFGFLPVLGFWMMPLGLAFVALDIPPMRHRIDAWMEKLHHSAGSELTAPPRLEESQHD